MKVILLMLSGIWFSADLPDHNLDRSFWRNTYYADRTVISEEEFMKILHSDADAYSMYNIGTIMRNTGKYLMLAAFCLLLIIRENRRKGNEPFRWMPYAGWSGLCIGVCVYAASYFVITHALKMFNH